MVVRYKRPIRPDELYHFGILGMKWGVRRYQNEDGSWKGAGARARHAQQQAASESGHTKHQTHSSSGGSGKKTKKKHSTAKTVAKVAGVSLAVAAGAYAAKKTGIAKKVASHGTKTLSQIRNKAKNAYNSERSLQLRGKAKSKVNGLKKRVLSLNKTKAKASANKSHTIKVKKRGQGQYVRTHTRDSYKNGVKKKVRKVKSAKKTSASKKKKSNNRRYDASDLLTFF